MVDERYATILLERRRPDVAAPEDAAADPIVAHVDEPRTMEQLVARAAERNALLARVVDLERDRDRLAERMALWCDEATVWQKRAEQAERERDEARRACAEAGIVLEALWAAEHDGIALAPTTKAAIRDVLPKVRAALGQGG